MKKDDDDDDENGRKSEKENVCFHFLRLERGEMRQRKKKDVGGILTLAHSVVMS